jgi:hypothetical protein
MVITSIVMKITAQFSALSTTYSSTKEVTQSGASTGLCTLCDEGCALLTRDFD